MARAVVLCALALLGCGDDTSDLATFAVPTEVAVNPQDFLGDTPCSTHPGALQSYVVTLDDFDNREDTTAFAVASSQPTPCSLITGFREVIVLGHVYTAQIDGYELPAGELEPFGGPASGAREMVRKDTGARVEPRWTTRCGGSARTGVEAVASRRVAMRPCEPLSDAEPSDTALSIGPEDVLGPDACSLAPTVTIEDETVDCDADALVFPAEPGASLTFYATATVADTLVGTLCSASAAAGLTIAARCNPPAATGGVTVALGDLCEPGSYYDVLDDGVVLNSAPLPCEASAQIGPLAPGVALLDVVLYGASLESLICGADVEPGKVIEAICLPPE